MSTCKICGAEIQAHEKECFICLRREIRCGHCKHFTGKIHVNEYCECGYNCNYTPERR